jgi:alpha-tubulin suppressor-like RCC1 family protein
MFLGRNSFITRSAGGVAPGQLWVWGKNNNGQLGLGNTTYYSSPKQIGSLTTWSKVSAGDNFIFAITTNGELYAIGGKNNNGELGLGNTTYYSSPKQIGALTTWNKVSSGATHTLAIKTNGTLWGWGYNSSGSLGLGDTAKRSSPVQVGALTAWSSVKAGQNMTIALKSDGTVWVWGSNSLGQLGLGNTTSYSSPKQLGALTTWSSINANYSNALAINSSNQLFTWGTNYFGQLGINNRTYYSSPKQVSGSWAEASLALAWCVARKTDNTMWTWGLGNEGQIGNSVGYTKVSSPTQVGALTTWLKVGASKYTGMAIRSDKTAWVWGVNNSGQLGIGTVSNTSSPVQLGTLTKWETTSQITPGNSGAATQHIAVIF